MLNNMWEKRKNINATTVIILLPLLFVLLYMFSVPSILRYRVESLWGDPTTLLWAEGITVYEQATLGVNQVKKISTELFWDSDGILKDTISVTITNLNNPAIWLFGDLINSADKLTVVFNGEIIKKGVSFKLESSERPPFWEDFYLDKHFGVTLPTSLYKYDGINEIVLRSGRAVERYYFKIESSERPPFWEDFYFDLE